MKILDDIMGRIVGQGELNTEAKPFLWLNGAAGAGKSAIAQSTIERCIERGLPLASFFFNKSDATRNHAKPLVATLAYQLYQSFPGTEVQTEIISAINKEPLIFTKQIQQQFTALVVQPLKTYLSRHQLPEPQTSTSFLIMIDGLDECIERASQKAILSGLADSVRDSGPYIRIFVASRPEYDITQSFCAKHLKDVHTHLSLDLDLESNVEADIKLYLSDQFEQIKDDCNSDSVFWPKLGQSWPGEEVIEKLVQKSSRQFIYAATVIRYITSARPRLPGRSLDMVLNLRPHDGDNPFAELDALYEKILESCKNIEKVLEVLSLKMMRSLDWKVSVYENILSYEEGEIRRLFYDLGALVTLRQRGGSIDPQDMRLTILHASLSDYLRDEARSKQFHIDLRGKDFGRHMTKVLQYLASCSCDWDPRNWTSPATCAVDLFIINSYELHSCTIPPELRQAAFSFPLEKFLAPHISSRIAWQRGALEFVVAFLHILRLIALNDPTCSYIENYQYRNLDSVMIHPLQRYFDDGQLALFLALFCHLGSHRFVPFCDMTRTFGIPFYKWTGIPLDNYGVRADEELRLAYLWGYYLLDTSEEDGYLIDANDGIDYLAYFDYMHHLLRSVSAPTPTVYAKATKECLYALRSLPMPSFFWKHIVPVADVTDDDPCPLLVFDNKHFFGPWFCIEPEHPHWTRGSNSLDKNTVFMGEYEDYYRDLQSDEDDEALGDYERESLGKAYFTILGYLIFFLPRCGKSDDLIAACQRQQTLYIEKPNNPFPIRWRRLHIEINNYLARI
ncbi:hypothetical protein CPC08DRAFT_267025 [Agrocybe pediades]|nr:hypothetical protein CPC08DRAFT_267025 [Agrocybe pediades]